MKKWVIGVDEAGRGPLAGPVAVGVACVPNDFDWKSIPGVGDSKKISPKNREAIFRRAKQLQKEGSLTYAVGLSSAKVIDAIGIVPAINKTMHKALLTVRKQNRENHRATLGKKENIDVRVLLDGGLKAPKEYVDQETIIRGDSKEKVIGLASIMAKVTRDRHMRRLASLAAYTPYDFAIHKGYGTRLHRSLIKKYGLSKEHRKSFCKNLQK